MNRKQSGMIKCQSLSTSNNSESTLRPAEKRLGKERHGYCYGIQETFTNMSISRALHRLQSIFKHNPSGFMMENHQMRRLTVVLSTISKEGAVDSFRELLQVTHLSQDAHAVVSRSQPWAHSPVQRCLSPAVAARCSRKNFHHRQLCKRVKSEI